MPLTQLRRVRWAVRATLALGVAASVVANILHARDNPISQAIAAWPPLALLLTVELISRVPVHRRHLAVTRFVATATIAGIAAWVSYWHMAGVAARYGETGASPYLLPLSVDGLIVVASICLVELGGRIAAAQAENRAGTPVTAVQAESGTATPVTATGGAPAAVVPPAATPEPLPAATAPPEPLPAATAPPTEPPPATTTTARGPQTRAKAAARPAREASGGTAKSGGARPRRPVAETAALAAAIEAERPHATEADVAQELGITPARLRAVRRQARELDLAA
ncbi:Protein of unknown function [Micromonospora pattaloongensis]|uniref:DUF2637 domain-containing protein n=1 Tax=Micromonospora pattaloongensis TaxID=405436 RepID=A0A1H3K3K7_9ACTN|nr:DUF2637 domain-containing protein [Micromonospora pattaloongensis]SDY46787.1 Protein of unknown function [Micromonospora pattaloongensis]